MTHKIRWGIMGTGLIAKLFAHDLNSLPGAELLAVGSRKIETAQEFARQYKVPRIYKSYEDLVRDKEIEIVYIATPNYRHKQDCILALEAGKHILCEKPFTINAREAREVIQLARKKKLFCMEGMWMRFFPLIQKVKSLIKEGEIGEIKMLTADFGSNIEFSPNSRFFNLEVGGGALLDRGVYTLSLAYFLLGAPSQIVSQAIMGKTKVDEQTSMILKYSHGQLANLSASICSATPNEATIVGSLKTIKIHSRFFCPTKISITDSPVDKEPPEPSKLKTAIRDFLKKYPVFFNTLRRLKSCISILRPKTTIKIKKSANCYGFSYEAEEAMNCIRSAKQESDIMPLEETLSIMETMDKIRHQCNSLPPLHK